MKNALVRTRARRVIVAGLATIATTVLLLSAAPAQAATTAGISGSGTAADGGTIVTTSTIKPFEYSGVVFPIGFVVSEFEVTEPDTSTSAGTCILPIVWNLEMDDAAETVAFQCLGLARVTDPEGATSFSVDLLDVSADGTGDGSITINERTFAGSATTPIDVTVTVEP